MIIVAATCLFVFGYDLYYTLYIHEKSPSMLDPDEFQEFKIREIIPLTHDTSLFRIRSNNRDHLDPLKVPVPSSVVIKDDTCQIARSYTPITFSYAHFDIIVKRYSEGSVSRFLHSKDVGDTLEVRGPIQAFPYRANLFQEIGMVAGGTGITPMYQLIKRILKDKHDQTRMTLVYANKTVDDILLHSELEQMAKAHPEKLQILYTVDQPPADKEWDGAVGYVDAKMLKENMPAVERGQDVAVLVCGPEGFLRHVSGTKLNEREQGQVGGILKSLGYDERQVFKF
ncbi:NADH-cytochrome b5 reductase [Rhizophlyctis rosea]|nr:NADH-cytochrome b5 reductase [Rhizophlyctis rosea]